MSRLRAFAETHAASAASVVVLAIAAKAILGRIGTFDLGFDDECWILGIGQRLPGEPLPPADYGPLYAVWYRLLSALEPDPVKLYPFNWVVLELGLVGLLYALARRSGAPRLAASLVTMAWSVSRAVTLWPFAVYFSTGILAVGALAATSTKDRLVATTIIVIATAFASFARPELATPGLALAGIAIVWSVARAVRERRPRALAAALLVGATIASLVHVLGSPIGGGRSFFAFEQHYALSRVEAGGLKVNPWSAYPSIVGAAFPHARSISEAARENPSAFAWHVGHNASLLPGQLGSLFDVSSYVPLAVRYGLVCGAGAVLVLGAFALWRCPWQLSPRLVAWLPIWIPVGASFVAAVLLIRPRDHYLVPFAFFATVTLASACGAYAPHRRCRAPLASLAGLAAAITLLALLPTYRAGALPSLLGARGTPAPTDFEGQRTVAALRALALPGERVILEAEWSHAVYARIPVRRVKLSAKDCPFFEFLERHDIDLVIASPRLRADERFRDDPEFPSFLTDGGDHRGFVLHKVEQSQTVIAVRARRGS